MNTPSALKKKLAHNQLSIGSWITMDHPSIPEIMATAGFDWLTVDMEHSSLGLKEVQVLVQCIQGQGIEALVRVGENNPTLIKRVMDTGVTGIIAPMVNTAADAASLVSAVKYPPHGKRGVGLARAQGYGTQFNEYVHWLREESVAIAQIEHIDAVPNLEDILTKEGIDGCIVGPYDLSGSMGRAGQFEDPTVIEALTEIEAVCTRLGKPLGLHVVQPDPDELKMRVDSGYTFLAFSTDFLFLGEKCREAMKLITQ